MGSFNVYQLVQKIHGQRGLIIKNFEIPGTKEPDGNNEIKGAQIKRIEDEISGAYTFMPVKLYGKGLPIQGYDLPNPVIMFSRETEWIGTDVVGIGHVNEKSFLKPCDITIICTLIGESGKYPVEDFIMISKIWKGETGKPDCVGDLLTLKCALTSLFLSASDNFILTSMEILNNEGAENVEAFRLTGRSNFNFSLELEEKQEEEYKNITTSWKEE